MYVPVLGDLYTLAPFMIAGVRKPSPEISSEQKRSLSTPNTLAKSFTAKTLKNIVNCSCNLKDCSAVLKHTKVRQAFQLFLD